MNNNPFLLCFGNHLRPGRYAVAGLNAGEVNLFGTKPESAPGSIKGDTTTPQHKYLITHTHFLTGVNIVQELHANYYPFQVGTRNV